MVKHTQMFDNFVGLVFKGLTLSQSQQLTLDNNYVHFNLPRTLSGKYFVTFIFPISSPYKSWKTKQGFQFKFSKLLSYTIKFK